MGTYTVAYESIARYYLWYILKLVRVQAVSLFLKGPLKGASGWLRVYGMEYVQKDDDLGCCEACVANLRLASDQMSLIFEREGGEVDSLWWAARPSLVRDHSTLSDSEHELLGVIVSEEGEGGELEQSVLGLENERCCWEKHSLKREQRGGVDSILLL